MKIIKFKNIDSTNLYLKNNYKDLDDFTWVISDHQTHGKGRMQNSWFGNDDSLMCSLLLKTNIEITKLSLVPLVAAQSLHKTLSTYHENIKIKWPNDLYIYDKKIAGILTESILETNKILAIIVGFGVNLNQSTFSKKLNDKASSLYLHTHQIYDKDKMLNKLSNQFLADLNEYHQHSQKVINYCNQYNYLKNHDITYVDHQQSYDAKALSINKDGHLIVETKDGKIYLNSSQVSLKKMKISE